MTKVVYFGNERLVSGLHHTEAPILRGLIERGYEVVAVVSHHSHSQSRSQRDLEVAEIAQSKNIPLFLPNKPSEIIEELKTLNADIAVLAAYGRIVSQQIIDLFPLGIVNIHPSLLPAYRGPTPIESALLNGDGETGISIMQLSAGMDEGPVYAQRIVAIEENDDKFHLYTRIASTSVQLFFEVFPKIVDGSLVPTPQDDAHATYSKLITKSDAIIDWSKPAAQIEREIRAFAGWPQSRTKLGSLEVIITKSQVVHRQIGAPGSFAIANDDAAPLLIQAKDYCLNINTIKPLGKKEMPIQAFLAGYGSRLGN